MVSATESLIERLKTLLEENEPQLFETEKETLRQAATELEALRSRCEEACQIIEAFAPLTDEGSRSRRFLAARALQGGKAE